MRVIAGSARGRPLKGPPGPATRATSDKVRGVIFDVLAAVIPGARVLDLYAGTGALGIEALSRGAESCLFVEKAHAACRVIEANLATTRLAAQATVWCTEVSAALERLEADNISSLDSTFRPPYDVIVLDPPYGDPTIVGVVERLGRSVLLARGGFVVLEHGKRLTPPRESGILRLHRARLYGDTAVTIWHDAQEVSER